MNTQQNSLFALVDCNNFYVSCERVFAPRLAERPVVVMSNNDGCVVSRSDEAKAIGIGMGQPIFQARDIIHRHGVELLSSNYTLYGDMSRRVMTTLGWFTPEMEVYSIDEAFLALAGIPAGDSHVDFNSLAHRIRITVKRWTGIPVSVGIGPTKTLAKLANGLAKRTPDAGGVYDLTDPPALSHALATTPVDRIWGVGLRFAARLNEAGIVNGLQLRDADDHWIKQVHGIMGLRSVHELRGISCFPLEESPPPRQGIAHTRTFSRRITRLSELREAAAAYATRATEKLRRQGLAAGVVTVFVMTNLFTEKSHRYFNSRTFELPTPSNDTAEIIELVTRGVEQIHREGYEYKKAGVLLDSLVPEAQAQASLFDQRDRGRARELMRVVDTLNDRFSSGTIGWASAGLERPWQVEFRQRSPRYTTCWRELPVVRAS
jgi:DNA polymerase V